MEVENAAQMAAQAVWKACDETELPATTKCADLTSAVANAVQSTSLGTAVSFQSGSPSEGYYCLDTSDTLRFVSSVASRPADCSAVGRADLEPADYIQVQVTYSYTPIFPGITVMSAGPITETTLMRLG